MNAAIIGASSESIHTIELAKQHGLQVVALDGNSEAEGLRYADTPLKVDISKEDLAITACAMSEIGIVLTVPIGRYLTTIGAVNDALSLPGISKKAAQNCVDKFLFHQKMAQENLRAGHCILLSQSFFEDQLRKLYAGEKITKEKLVEELTKKHDLAWKEVGYPAVLKPRFGSGSRGIVVLNSEEELLSYLADYLSELSMDDANPEDQVFEEIAPGDEYGLDAMVEGDAFKLILLRKKLLTPLPERQAVGYISVTQDLESELVERVKDYMQKAVSALGLKDTLMHADLMITDEEIYAIEMSPRPSGHNLHNLFTPLATGVDEADQYICYQLHKMYSFEPKYTRKMIIRYFDFEDARIEYVPGKSEVREVLRGENGVSLIDFCCNILPGERMSKVPDGHSIMGRGYFILEAEDKAVSDQCLMDACTKVLSLFETESFIEE